MDGVRHAPSHSVPPEAALDPDPALQLAWADMHTWIEAGNDGSCRYGACESDEACTCQEGEPE